jgi:Flp pilus assembly protein TadG
MRSLLEKEGLPPSTGDAVVAPPATATSNLRRSRRRGKKQRGQSLVEFALIAPLFLLLVFGIVDFGIAFYSWITITNAAREGARLGAVQGTEAEITSRVNAATDHLDPDDLDIVVTNAEGPPGEAVSVEIDYDYNLVTPLAGILGLSTVNISSTSTMRLE